LRSVLICVLLIVLAIAAFEAGRAQQVDPGTQLLNLDLSTGCTPYHGAATTASTNSTELIGRAARLCDLTVVNTTTTIYYIHVYDVASAPTCTTTGSTLKHTFPIPPASASGGASGIQRTVGVLGGEAYANGIGYCVTGGGGDGDNTNAAAGVYIEGSYK
jgi:hypothetical protein